MDGFKYEINFYTDRSKYDFGDAKVEFIEGRDSKHCFINLVTDVDQSSTIIELHISCYPLMLLNTAVKKSIVKDLPELKVSSKDIQYTAENLQTKIFTSDVFKSIQTYLEDAIGLPWYLLEDYFSTKKYQLDDFLAKDESTLAELLNGIMNIINNAFLENYDMFLERLKAEAERRLGAQAKTKAYKDSLLQAEAYDVIINYNPSAQVTEYSKQFRVTNLSDIPLAGEFTGKRSNSKRTGSATVNYCSFDVNPPAGMSRAEAINLLKDALVSNGIECRANRFLSLPLIKVWKADSNENGVTFCYSNADKTWIPLKDAKDKVKSTLKPIKISWSVSRW